MSATVAIRFVSKNMHMLANGHFAPWADPAVVELQRLAMRPPLVISNTLEDARVGRAHRRKVLDGVWRLLLMP